MSKAVRDMAPLRSEVRELGAALGRVITRIEGRGTFDTVELLRRLAKARRAGEAGAERELARAVAQLDPEAAFNQAMAFTLYFELVNLAEENFRITLLRRRRVAHARGTDDGRAIRESIDAAVTELKAAGVEAPEMQRLVDRLAIELVFTAHPTEAKRRTLLAKLRRLARILRARALPESTPDTAVLEAQTVEREIAALWLTDRSRTVRPEVKDEARTGLWYFDRTLIETMPRLQADMERALARHYPGVRPPRRWLSFGSWIGGDRDGNPEVTVSTTAEVLLLHRRLAIEKLRVSATELGRMLTVSDRRDTVVPALKRGLREGLHLSKHFEKIEKRYPHEPYRLLLGVLQERLEQARDELFDPRMLLGCGVVGSCLSRETVRETLETIKAGLEAGRAGMLTGGDLAAVENQFEVFGLHTARLDLRQHSSLHEAAVAEVLGRPDYPALGEAQKVRVLTEAIPLARKLGAESVARFSEATRSVVDPLVLAGDARQVIGAEALGLYIISMTDGVSDVLEVELLQKLAGSSLPIAPLFETLEDLERAPRGAGRALRAAGAPAGAPARHAGLLGQQQGLRVHHRQLGALQGAGGDRPGVQGGGGGRHALPRARGKHRARRRAGRQGDPRPARRASRREDPGDRAGRGPLDALPRPRPRAPHPRADGLRGHAGDTRGRRAGRDAGGVDRGDGGDEPRGLRGLRGARAQRPGIPRVLAPGDAHRGDRQPEDRLAADLPARDAERGRPEGHPLGLLLDAEPLQLPRVVRARAARSTSVLRRGPRARARLRAMHAGWPFFQTLVDNAQLTMRKADMGIASLYAGLVQDSTPACAGASSGVLEHRVRPHRVGRSSR
jgi:phosphoenolpyruvate carboxylase